MNRFNLNKNEWYKIKQILTITLLWVVISNLFYLDLYTSVRDMGYESEFQFTFAQLVLGNSLAPFLAGIIGGWSLIRLKPMMGHYSYGRTLLNTFFVFTIIFVFVSWVAALFYYSVGMGKGLFEVNLNNTLSFIYSSEGMRNYVRWLLIVSVTNLFIQIDDKFGPGVLWAIITGKYQKPVDEQRIVMFLDIKNSTGIAEDLGGRRYHRFLRDFFNDITEPILRSNGLIHQYVGDEVVVVWEVNDGASNANCLRCYFEIEKEIQARAEHYKNEYGVVPQFKAGLHSGDVTIGEIGTIKRDISLSGDTLNTTSRIQEKCKEENEKVLVSKSLLNLIPVGLVDFFELGTMKLKGKSQGLELAAIRGLV